MIKFEKKKYTDLYYMKEGILYRELKLGILKFRIKYRVLTKQHK